jgi:hypothetical protein
VTFVYGMIAGAYVLGFGFTLFALSDEHWLDRVIIATCWPWAVVRSLLWDL